MILCLNLCDAILSLNRTKTIEQIISEEEQQCNCHFSTIYIGSYFCEQYFLHIDISIIQKIAEYCKNTHRNVSIVIPQSSQKDLQQIKKVIHQWFIVLSSHLESFTVNDYGMARYISEKYPLHFIFLGRLLYKKSRDVRYVALGANSVKADVISNSELNLLSSLNLKGIEVEGQAHYNHIGNLEICCHAPLTYISVGMVCEFASQGLPNQLKFRPNSHCSCQCRNCYTEYRSHDAFNYIKIGRAIYYNNVFSIPSDVNRMIVFPISMYKEIV